MRNSVVSRRISVEAVGIEANAAGLVKCAFLAESSLILRRRHPAESTGVQEKPRATRRGGTRTGPGLGPDPAAPSLRGLRGFQQT
jgi:hypothetical protein